MRKIPQLILPFKTATTCMMTEFSEKARMLILQNKHLQAVGYTYKHGIWKRQFTLDGFQYELMQAYGSFLIGVNKYRDRTVKLLELGGKSDNTIVTEMPIGPIGQADFQIDAFQKQSNFEVSFERGTNKFTWSKFDQQA